MYGLTVNRTMSLSGHPSIINKKILVPAAEIQDWFVSGPFSWFQSRQIFHETHETEEPYIFLAKLYFLKKTPYTYISSAFLHYKTNKSLKKVNQFSNPF